MPAKQNARDIFLRALDLAPADRVAYLDEACGDDATVRQRVEALLRANDEPGAFLSEAKPWVGDVSPLPPAEAGNGTSAHASNRSPETEDYGDPTARVGAIIAGKYKLIEEIGEGGMGSVYMAQQTQPVKRAVAVKVIKAGMDSKAVLVRFEAERQALALMDHPNIARVLDAGTTEGGRPFFVMELVKGTPITQFCDERKLPPRQRLELFVPVCQAIQHAHQKGIIHRDIKPSNVLVALYDDRPVPKVIDFGVAKAAGQTLTDKTLMTGFGAVVGTPEYMSPEQASLNNLDIDTRSDVYSLGVLLYELLTGTTPVDRKSLGKAALLEILRIVREVEAPRPSAKLSSSDTLPSVAANRGTEPARLSKLMKGELDWVLLKALEKDRARRYDTANALSRDIQRYLADEVVEARPPSAAYRLKKFVRRHKGQVLAASLVLVALLAGMAGTTWGLIQARRQEQEARRQEQIAREETAEKEKARLAEAERVKERDAALKLEAERVKERDAALKLEAERVKERDKALGKADEAIQREIQRVKERDYQLGISDFLLAGAAYDNRDMKLAIERLDKVPQGQRGWEWHYLKRQTRGGLFTLKGHTKPVVSVSYSPDGARIVTGSRDTTAKVWDARTGVPLLELKGHTQPVSSVSYSPDGARIVTGAGDNYKPGEAKVWDARTGAPLLDLKGHTGGIASVSYSPDGARIVTGSADTTAMVWDAQTGAPLLDLKGHTGGITSVSYSPDGARIVTGSYDKTAKVWDARTGTPLLDLKGHTGGIASVSYSPDGTRIVTGGSGGGVTYTPGEAKVWDARTGAPLLDLRGHTGAIDCVSFSPDGARIVTGSYDRTAKVWDARTGTPLLDLKGHTDWLRSASFSPDGARIVTGAGFYLSGPGEAKVWDARTGMPLLDLKGHTNGITSVSYSPDGARIVTGSNERIAKVWDARTGAPLLDLKGHTGAITSVSYSPNGTRIVTGSGDTTATVWDARTGAPLLDLKGHTGAITSVRYSPDGARIVTGSYDQTAKVWDARTGKHLLDLKGRMLDVYSVSYSPDGTRIVTGGHDHSAKVWDARTGKPLLDLKGHRFEVNSVSYSPDGTRIVTGSYDQTAKVWDARTGAPLLDLKGHTDRVLSVSYSPDGTRILTGSSDATAKVWDARTGVPLLDLKGHTAWVSSASFSPDGSRIVTGGPDGTAKVWDTRAGQEVTGGEKLDAEELEYRLFHTRPNDRYYAEEYFAARRANDRFAARFYLDRILSFPEHRTTPAFLARNALQGDALVIVRTGFHHPALAKTPYDRGVVALLAGNGDRLARRLVAQEFLRDGQPGPAIPLLFWCLASRPAASPPVEELLLAQAYTDMKQPDAARRFSQAAAEWLNRAKGPTDGPGHEREPNGDPRRNAFDWEPWHECDVFRAVLRLPAVLRGEEKLTDNVERLTFAQLAHDQKKFAGATRLWVEALASDPKLGDNRRAQHRYNAACAAALAAAGQGKDEPPLDDAAKGKLRGQALDCLTAELTAWGKYLESGPPQDGPAIVQVLSHWQKDTDLAGIRDSAALTKLPAEEQKAFTQLWADVTALLNRAQTPQALAAAGDWSAAAAAYARVAAWKPLHDGELGFEYAAVLLLAGDQVGYGKLCGEMLERSGRPRIRPYYVARACTLAPDSVKDAALPGKKAEDELKRSAREFWSLTEQGALAYRAGRYDEAATLLEQSLKAEGTPGPAMMSWLWLSLVEHRRGKPAEARAWLEKAMKWLAQNPRAEPVQDAATTGRHLHNWLEAQVLRREAEALILSKK